MSTSSRATSLLLFLLVLFDAKGFAIGEHPFMPSSDERMVSLAREEQMACNGLLDNLLIPVRSEILRAGRDEIMLPNVTLYQYGAKVECTHGKIRRLSTLFRKQDSYLTWGGGNVTIVASLGFDDLHVSYDVRASMLLLSKKATIEAKIGSNSVHVKVGVNFYEDRCWIVVDEISVVSLGNIDVTITGFGILNSAVETVMQKLVDPDAIRTRLNEEFNEKVKFRSSCLVLIPGFKAIKMLS